MKKIIILLGSLFWFNASIPVDLENSLKELKRRFISLEESLSKLPKTYATSVEFKNFYTLAEKYSKEPKKYNNQFNPETVKSDFFTLLTKPNLKTFDLERIKFILSNIPDWFAEEIAFKLIKATPQKFTDIIETYNEQEISSIALSPDKTMILCGTYLDKKNAITKVFLFDLKTKKKTHEWQLDKDIRSVAFHPTKKIIAVGTFGKGKNAQNIKIYQYEPFQKDPVHTIDAHDDDVTAVTFNSNGSLLASTADDAAVKVWYTNTWKELITFPGKTSEGHKSYGHSVSFNSNSSLLASSAMDGTVKVWDLKNNKLLYTFVIDQEKTTLFGSDDHSSSALFHPTDPTYLVISLTSRTEERNGVVELYTVNTDTYSKVLSYPYADEGAISLGFSSDLTKLIARGPNGKIFVQLYFHPMEKRLLLAMIQNLLI